MPYRFAMLLITGLLLPQPLWAEDGRADLMLIPGRVILGDKDAYASVVMKNPGNAAGHYSVELIDMRMLENGNVVPTEPGKIAEYSALPYLHIAPRSMTLKPGETQSLRLILRKPATLEDGEYRAHLKVRLVNENADETPFSVVTAKSISIAAKAHMVIIIPVIFRHGHTSYTMRIDAPKLSRDASGNPMLDMVLAREGNRSSMGDISVYYVNPEGKSQLLKFYPGIPVYRSTDRRSVSIPLDVPKELNLSSGSLKIAYTTPEEENSRSLAEATVHLPQ